jgi:hypothetical protein
LRVLRRAFPTPSTGNQSTESLGCPADCSAPPSIQCGPRDTTLSVHSAPYASRSPPLCALSRPDPARAKNQVRFHGHSRAASRPLSPGFRRTAGIGYRSGALPKPSRSVRESPTPVHAVRPRRRCKPRWLLFPFATEYCVPWSPLTPESSASARKSLSGRTNQRPVKDSFTSGSPAATRQWRCRYVCTPLLWLLQPIVAVRRELIRRLSPSALSTPVGPQHHDD